jgi:hypothetical protein
MPNDWIRPNEFNITRWLTMTWYQARRSVMVSPSLFRRLGRDGGDDEAERSGSSVAVARTSFNLRKGLSKLEDERLRGSQRR